MREFKNLAEIIIIVELLKKNKNSQILNFVKHHKIRNSRKFKHAKITRSTVILVTSTNIIKKCKCVKVYIFRLHV